ncbi:MAG TPA: histidine kinase [Solirubrobacteraceae bacterium]|nr:histidine kinase [Solirubrobacteraceae bacterium]
MTITLVAFGATAAIMAHGGWGQPSGRQLDLPGAFLAAAASAPLLFWRRAPLLVFIVTLLASATAIAIGYPGGPPIGATIALYLLATSRGELHPWSGPIAGLVTAMFAIHFVAFTLRHGNGVPLAQIGTGALIWAVAYFAGERARLRRQELAELEQRALSAERDAERDRRLAVAEERARIARDLHDSAAHAINVIALQAGAARLLQERDPARSRQALETVERVAHATVGEIDQIVHSLREPGDGRDRRVEPPPGLAALDALLAEQTAAGMTVHVTRHGTPRPVAPASDQAAYRILQEALTNSARHGAGAADVEVAFDPERLQLTITNPVAQNRAARPNGGGGHGLTGMRERASLLGGRLEANRVNGAFLVRASIPYGSVP